MVLTLRNKTGVGAARLACLVVCCRVRPFWKTKLSIGKKRNVGNGPATMFDCFGILFGCLLVSKHTSVNKKSLEGNLHGNLYKGLVMRVYSSGEGKVQIQITVHTKIWSCEDGHCVVACWPAKTWLPYSADIALINKCFLVTCWSARTCNKPFVFLETCWSARVGKFIRNSIGMCLQLDRFCLCVGYTATMLA